MILSERLRRAASLVTKGNRLADIGTDHGFVPIFLVQEGLIPSAVAMDVNRGPLDRAAEHIAEAGLGDRIWVRLSDGLAALRQGEADTVMIAGMGGALTVRILQEGMGLLWDPAAGEGIRELVLQPQSELSRVRRFLESHGWSICREEMVLEDGKFYPMMQCCPGRMELTEAQAQFGPRLMEKYDPILREYLLWRRVILNSNLASLERSGSPRAEDRRREISGDLELIQEVLDGYPPDLQDGNAGYDINE